MWNCGFVSQQARFNPFTVYAPVTCIGSPLCFIQYYVGGWLARITDGAAPPAITLLNPRLTGANIGFDFLTQAGRSYTVEFRDDLSAGSWQTLSNLTGDGALKTIARPGSHARHPLLPRANTVAHLSFLLHLPAARVAQAIVVNVARKL